MFAQINVNSFIVDISVYLLGGGVRNPSQAPTRRTVRPRLRRRSLVGRLRSLPPHLLLQHRRGSEDEAEDGPDSQAPGGKGKRSLLIVFTEHPLLILPPIPAHCTTTLLRQELAVLHVVICISYLLLLNLLLCVIVYYK